MIICGIKASHDGAVAVVEDGRLRFSVETEKLRNGERYSALGSLQKATDILAGEGSSPSDVAQFVVDGWYTRDASGAPPSRSETANPRLRGEHVLRWLTSNNGTGPPPPARGRHLAHRRQHRRSGPPRLRGEDTALPGTTPNVRGPPPPAREDDSTGGCRRGRCRTDATNMCPRGTCALTTRLDLG